MRYLVGVDGGGTGCRAAIAQRSGKIIGTGHSGFANIMTDFDLARSHILTAVEKAFITAGVDPVNIAKADAVLGLAGANGANYPEKIKSVMPFGQCQIETDAEIALEGALGSSDGTVAIIGTGSVYVTRQNGEIRTVGGWGFNVGDRGSGSRLGRSLVQEALLAYDGVQKGSPVTEKVLADFDNDPVKLSDFAHSAIPGDFARFAPLLFEFLEHDDAIAKIIVNKAIIDVEAELRAILPADATGFCMLGGLGKIYQTMLSEPLKSMIMAPRGDALAGAVNLAVARFGSRERDADE